MAFILPPVETDVVWGDFGVSRFGRVAIHCQNDTLALAMVEDLEGVEADLLPLFLGEVAAAVKIMRVSDG